MDLIYNPLRTFFLPSSFLCLSRICDNVQSRSKKWTHKQTNIKRPFLTLETSFLWQNNREQSFSEHVETFHSSEYKRCYAIFSDWNGFKIPDNFLFYVKIVYQDFFKVSPDWFFFTNGCCPGFKFLHFLAIFGHTQFWVQVA